MHAHSRARSFRETQLMAAGWGFAETKALLGGWGDADVQNQLDGIVRNKAIYQKVHVATAMAELGYSCTWRRAKLPVAQRHKHGHENEIHLFFTVSYDSHMNPVKGACVHVE